MTVFTHYAATAYDRAEDGSLVATMVLDCRSAGVALRVAGRLARTHAGAVAWSRRADLPHLDFGERDVIAAYGEALATSV